MHSQPIREAFVARHFFYVGGSYEEGEDGESHMSGQMYVEHLVPLHGVSHQYPLVFVHGMAQTGTNWLNKPDGEPGWATWFLQQGYEVYIIDRISTGRSQTPCGAQVQRKFSANLVEQKFTACSKFHLWPQAKLHTQWPGAGLRDDPIFDNYFASVSNVTPSPNEKDQIKIAGAELLTKTGPVVVVAHSAGCATAWLWADTRPDLVKLIVSVEPTGLLFDDAIGGTGNPLNQTIASLPLSYSGATRSEIRNAPNLCLRMTPIQADAGELQECALQAEPALQLTHLSRVPVLLVTGEASYHAVFDRGTVEFLRQAGVAVEWLRLAHQGVHGNGHMMFMEKNSDEIAGVLHRRILDIVNRVN